MNSEDEKEKQNKAGHPLFIVIIFVALLGFLFVIPEIYKKYNSNIADFLGIGSQDKDKNEDDAPSDDKSAISAHYQLGSRGSLVFNEITLTDISLGEDGILTFTVNVNEGEEDTIDLDTLNYYIEFYENKQTFIGRRSLHGKVTKFLTFQIDVSNLNITTTTYMTLSHISDDAIGGSTTESDESGLSELVCNNNLETYEYEFYLKNLTRVTYKYNYTNDNMSEYASELLKYQKIEKEYNEFTGITASIMENANTFVFISEFDYSEISSYSKIGDPRIFEKGSYDHVIKFKMDAEGFDCE